MPEARKVTPAPSKRTTAKGGAKAKSEVLDVDRFIAEIVAGRHTGNLGRIIAAVQTAALTGASSMRWRVKVDALGDEFAGREFTEDTITLRAVTTAERIAGHSWKTMSPVESAVDCHALIVAWLVEDEDHTMAAALEVANRVTLGVIPDMIDTYEVVHGPKGDGTASPGSPG